MKRVAVLCKSDYLYQKIALALKGFAECERIDSRSEAFGFDVCFTEDGGEYVGAPFVTMSERGDSDLTVPFGIEEIRKKANERAGSSAMLRLDVGGRVAFFKDKTIKLTELEGMLLSLLISEVGRFFTREEILRAVWDKDTDPGIVNVYIHYLREKLEKTGERVIISSRGCGYKIDEKYLGGNANAEFD